MYWRYVNFSGGGLQFPPFDMNNITDSSWTYYEWDFYPTSDDARLDIYWAASQGRFWIDDVSMQLKERSVVSIYSLPEPWRLNIGDQDTCNILVELRDSSNLRVSNGQSQITFVNLDPNILTLVSPTVVNSVFGKAECQCIGTAIAGIGRIEIQSGNLRDTLWISNREKHMPDDFFHIGTWLFASTNSADNQDLIEDLDSLGMNVVFPINGGTAATLSFLNAIQS